MGNEELLWYDPRAAGQRLPESGRVQGRLRRLGCRQISGP